MYIYIYIMGYISFSTYSPSLPPDRHLHAWAEVKSVAFSPDGSLVVTASMDLPSSYPIPFHLILLHGALSCGILSYIILSSPLFSPTLPIRMAAVEDPAGANG